MQDEQVDDGRIAGVQFGDTRAIARTMFGGGYRAKISGHGYFNSGVQYATGSRSVPEGADGAGDYKLTVTVFSVGLAFGF